ncbi:MAG: methyltransferase domain-containing protein [Acidobacteriota bacterium]
MAEFPFDRTAAEYDETFSHSLLGRRMRQAVWRRIDRRFVAGQHLLEIGCGTGEDAVHLARRGIDVLATDRSAEMVGITRGKAQAEGLDQRIEARQLAIEELAALSPRRFDGVLSNFGALNCVEDLGPVAEGLAACLKPGAPMMLCIMGPLVPWEWAWYLTRGDGRSAFRRLRRGGVPWRGLTIRYPSLRALRRTFAPAFRWRGAAAVGALLPPSYAESWATRHPRTVAWLDRWERRLETWPPLPWLADHYLAELERR